MEKAQEEFMYKNNKMNMLIVKISLTHLNQASKETLNRTYSQLFVTNFFCFLKIIPKSYYLIKISFINTLF